jgi:hypothetical protein
LLSSILTRYFFTVYYCPGNFRKYVDENINKAKLPYLVVCSHVHFDHIGGNYRFSGPNSDGCLGICMGGRKKAFTNNFELTSLCASHGCRVREFKVTKWLKDGDLIYLDENDRANPLKTMQVIFTPGHTLDSISLFHFGENRLFIADLLYPYTCVSLSAVGHSMKDFEKSLQRLQIFIESVTKPSKSASDNQIPYSPSKKNLKLEDSNAESQNSTELNLPSTVESRIQNKSLDNGAEATSTAKNQLTQPKSMEEDLSVPPIPIAMASPDVCNRKVIISCGHVEANLEVSALREVELMCK